MIGKSLSLFITFSDCVTLSYLETRWFHHVNSFFLPISVVAPKYYIHCVDIRFVVWILLRVKVQLYTTLTFLPLEVIVAFFLQVPAPALCIHVMTWTANMVPPVKWRMECQSVLVTFSVTTARRVVTLYVVLITKIMGQSASWNC